MGSFWVQQVTFGCQCPSCLHCSHCWEMCFIPLVLSLGQVLSPGLSWHIFQAPAPQPPMLQLFLGIGAQPSGYFAQIPCPRCTVAPKSLQSFIPWCICSTTMLTHNIEYKSKGRTWGKKPYKIVCETTTLYWCSQNTLAVWTQHTYE